MESISSCFAENAKYANQAVMSEPSICFEFPPALIAFRQVAGNANRHLNTTLVGLKTLQSCEPVRPSDLVVAWSKPETEEEWRDTQNFALRGAMIAIVEGLDRYLRLISRIEGFTPIEKNNLLNGRKEAGASHRPTLPERVEGICASYPDVVNPAHLLCVWLLVAWRNRFAHFEHRGGLTNAQRLRLLTYSEFFRSQHGGANIRAVLNRYEAEQAPTLSDLSTLISASQRLVKALDAHLLFLQDPEAYAVSLTRYLIKYSPDPTASLEKIFLKGGIRAAGHVHAMMLENGGNHSQQRTASAPSLSRVRLNVLLGIGRTKASELFGIQRPRTGPGE